MSNMPRDKDSRALIGGPASSAEPCLPRIDPIETAMRDLGISRPLALLIERTKQEHDRLSDQLMHSSPHMGKRELIAATCRIGKLEHLLRSVAELRVLTSQNNDFVAESSRGTPEDRRAARELLAEIKQQHLAAVSKLRQAFIGTRPEWDRAAVVEMRVTEGQDQSYSFAHQLLAALTRSAEIRGLSISLDHVSEESPHGGGNGLREATFTVTGPGAYGFISLEVGTHRFETIGSGNGKPCTGRVAIVAHPDAEERTLDIDSADLRISRLRSGGAGGQNVNKVETGVRGITCPQTFRL